MKETFGGLLNMSSEYPMIINDVQIGSVEALYQSMRFPAEPDAQRAIIEEKSPLAAKRLATVLLTKVQSRPDWYQVKVKIMRWCLRVKLACHYGEVGKLLADTDSKDIVETSPDGYFWGGDPDGDQYVGANVFGQLLMELRNEFKTKSEADIKSVEMLNIPDFKLLGKPILSFSPGVKATKAMNDTDQLGLGL